MIDEKVKNGVDAIWDEAFEREAWMAPLIDIYETSEEYILEAQMPGVSKDGVKIKLEENQLIIMGKIDVDAMKDRKYVLKESKIGNYYRKLNLSDGIDSENVEASLVSGVLKVKLPKHSRLKSKTIEIN